MFAYCRNNPSVRTDASGTRDSLSLPFPFPPRVDEVGWELLSWYLNGNGEDFPTEQKHSDYLKKNKSLKKQVRTYLFHVASDIPVGEVVVIDVSISVIIENGEDIIGYQYLHGTNADVGGFHIQGTITRLNNGDCIFDLTYTWNDIMDPNPQYKTDIAKAAFAKKLPFANPTDYKISISWHNVSIGPAGGPTFENSGYGWLYN